MIRSVLLATSLFLSACVQGPSGPPAQPSTANVAVDVVQRIAAMDCTELSQTLTILDVVEQAEGLAAVLLASNTALLTATGLPTDILSQTQNAREQTRNFVRFNQLIKFCG